MIKVIRRLSHSITAWVSVGILIFGVTSSNFSEAYGHGAVKSSPTPTMCRTIKSEIMALWDPSRDGSGGFGDTPTLSNTPSYYFTIWSLRLASIANVSIPDLNKVAIGRELVSSALASNDANESARIPFVERLNLTTKTLQSLHLPVPDTILSALDTLRSGNLYRRDRTGGTTDWPATYLATQTLAAVRRPVPPAVIVGARTALPSARIADTPQLILSFGIPVLGTLSATPGLLTQLVPDITKVLSSFTTVLLSAGGVSAITAAGLVGVADIAASVGVAIPSVPSNFLNPLLTATGYYAVGQGQTHGDPQATFYAVRLGVRLSDRARKMLILGHIKQGWLSVMSRATLTSSYQAALIARMCKLELPHVAAFNQQIQKWMRDVTTQMMYADTVQTPVGDSIGQGIGAAKVCFLAQSFGMAISGAQRASLSEAVDRSANSISVRALGILPAGQLAAAIEQCHLKLATSTRRTLVSYLSTTKVISLEDALGLHIASVVFAAPWLNTRARELALRLKSSRGMYRFRAQVGTPDLISTAYGYAINGGSTSERVRAIANFNTPWGPSLAMIANVKGTLPIVNLASLAAGLSVLTDYDSSLLFF